MRRLIAKTWDHGVIHDFGPYASRFDAGAQSVVAGAPYGLQRRIGEVLAGWRKDAAKKDE